MRRRLTRGESHHLLVMSNRLPEPAQAWDGIAWTILLTSCSSVFLICTFVQLSYYPVLR